MKKRMSIILTVMAVVLLTACNNSTDKAISPAPVEQPKAVTTSTPVPKVEKDIEKIDIDLTEMSSTMVYSEVYNIMNDPETYIGKTIKMRGEYYNYSSYDGTVFFPACVIADATACCQQGIEFVLADGKYPEEGTEVTVNGTFRAYIDETDGGTYYHLEDAVLS